MPFFSRALLMCFRSMLLFSVLGSQAALADNKEQTLIMMGSAIETCTSLSTQFCNTDTALGNEQSAQYLLTPQAIKNVKAQWPTADKSRLVPTINNLNKLLKKHSASLSKPELLWAWRDIAGEQLSQLSQIEFDYVFDMLEVAQLNGQSRAIKIDVENSKRSQVWLADSYKFIAASLKVKAQQPTLLVLTTGARDPYADANYYETVLSQMGVAIEWLPLTPALVSAMQENQCDQLATYQIHANIYNRAAVYPKRIADEKQTCQQGLTHLIERIKASTGIMLVGEEFDSSTEQRLSTALFDSQGNAYPWTRAIADAPVLITSGYSGNLLAGDQNPSGNFTVKPIPSLAALQGEQSILKNGLGSVPFALLDTYFSEQNRTAGLATSLSASEKTDGFGIDEHTSLVIIKAPQGNVLTVLGERGVVHLQSKIKQQFKFSYWPAGAVIEMKDNIFSLSQRSIDNALSVIKMPPLPMQRFSNILTNGKFRSLTQSLCLSQDKTAVGQQDEFLVTLKASENTQYHRLNSSMYGCAIEQLNVGITII